MNWRELKQQLDNDIENGYDPLYEQTQSGEYLQAVCVKVEDELGIWGEPSIQGGVGLICFMTIDEDDIVFDIDYQDFNNDVIELAFNANSEFDFTQSYQEYLGDRMSEYVPEDEENIEKNTHSTDYDYIYVETGEDDWYCVEPFTLKAAKLFANRWSIPKWDWIPSKDCYIIFNGNDVQEKYLYIFSDKSFFDFYGNEIDIDDFLSEHPTFANCMKRLK